MAGDALMVWRCRDRNIDLRLPLVMGVLNVTPDSFSDGGRFATTNTAFERAAAMVAEGAAIIDVGGESTRPGASPVDAQAEIERVVPVIERICSRLDVAVSIDTSKGAVLSAAVGAGACIVNDVNALRAAGARELAASLRVGVCLMHMQGEPRTMQVDPRYTDVVREVGEYLVLQRAACVAAGIAQDRICLDPGIGFGKAQSHNLSLLRRLPELVALGSPLLLGVSRKSFIGKILGAGASADVERRLYGGIGLAALAVSRGVKIIRTHDVAPTREAMQVVSAVLRESEEP
jgi:dihydropteroate synthase